MANDFHCFANLKCKDDFEVARTIVFLYCTSLVLRKEIPKVLRSQLISLLALYLQFGYNRESRKLAEKVFGVKPDTVYYMNSELTNAGILVKEEYTEKNLNAELLILQGNLKKSKGQGAPHFVFFINEG